MLGQTSTQAIKQLEEFAEPKLKEAPKPKVPKTTLKQKSIKQKDLIKENADIQKHLKKPSFLALIQE